jgi:hypothetical protein
MTPVVKMLNELEENIEWLETTEGDSVECISVENLEAILSRFLDQKIKISEDDNIIEYVNNQYKNDD